MSIMEPGRSVPVRGEADIIVVGAGPAGIAAALAAAEDGSSVVLIERHPFVGGNLTTGLPLLGFLGGKGGPVIAGLAQELVDRLARENAAGGHQRCPLHVSFTLVDPEAVKATALSMLVERGVEVVLHAQFCGVMKDGDNLEGVLIESKSGREAIRGKLVVDCTGDGDVAFRAGVPCQAGDESGRMQPPTLMFRLSGVDTDALRQSISSDPGTFDIDHIPNSYFGENRRFIVVGLRRLIRRARAAGLSIPTDRTILITGLRDGEVWVNMTRVKGVDSTDARSLTAGEIEARRQIPDIVAYLARFVPGFCKATLTQTAPFLGIRESRRIVGRYVLTRDDILGCRRFEDAVAVASYPIDIHRPADEDCTLEWCGDCYDIPYRCLLPLGIKNMLVAGRCVSTTHEAMAAIRTMPTCMAMGEAAGRGARMAVRGGIPPAYVDPGALRGELLARGAYLRT